MQISQESGEQQQQQQPEEVEAPVVLEVDADNMAGTSYGPSRKVVVG